MATDPSYRLFNKSEYLTYIISQLKTAPANTRFLLMAMDFEPSEPLIAELVDAMEAAAQRGVSMTFSVDARCFLDSNGMPDPAWYRSSRPGPLWFRSDLPAKLRPPYALKRDRLAALRRYPNVTAVLLNRPGNAFSLPVAGRSHIKTAIIDDEIIVGGCNLDYPQYTDLMVGWRSPADANSLYQTLRAGILGGYVRRSFGGQDKNLNLASGDRLLIDAGVPGQSLIFDEALQLIDSANDWLTITCQFFPNSITAQHLLAARNRGVKLRILFASARSHGLIDGTIQVASQLIERIRLPHDMFKDGLSPAAPKLHAKLIACDAGVMIGSHNYVNAGVRLGTAEICLKSSNPQFARQADNILTLQLTA